MTVEKSYPFLGNQGLYALKVQTRTGFVAESLLDGRKNTVGMKSNVSLLSEITLYLQRKTTCRCFKSYCSEGK
jgi:hypothetical protein